MIRAVKQEQENEYNKTVSIKNTGNIPCYVRARLEFSSSEILKLSELSADGTTYVSAAEYGDKIYELTNNDWVYNSDDGYYYYTKQVEVGKSTSKLLNSVKTTYGENQNTQRYDIIVYAESVQIYGNDGSIYNDYAKAWENFK